MIQKMSLFILLFLLVLLQVSFFPALLPFGSFPDLILLFTVLLVVKKGFDFSAPKIILAGLIYELMSFQLIGVKIFSLMLIAFFSGYFSKRFLVAQRNWRAPILLLLIVMGTIFDHLLIEGLLSVIEYFRNSTAININAILDLLIWKKIIANVLFAPIVYYMLKKYDYYFGLYA